MKQNVNNDVSKDSLKAPRCNSVYPTRIEQRSLSAAMKRIILLLSYLVISSVVKALDTTDDGE